MRSAIARASVSSSRCEVTVTSPSPLGPKGTSRLSGSGRCAAGSGEMIVSAACRMRAPDRKFVNSGSRSAGEPSRLREVGREVEQVRQRRAAPRVDVLVGVADGGDRVPARRTSRASAWPARRWCPGTRRAARRRTGRGTPAPTSGCSVATCDRELDLVAEVDHAEVALEPAEHRDRLRELDALERRVVDAVGARDLLEDRQALARRTPPRRRARRGGSRSGRRGSRSCRPRSAATRSSRARTSSRRARGRRSRPAAPGSARARARCPPACRSARSPARRARGS